MSRSRTCRAVLARTPVLTAVLAIIPGLRAGADVSVSDRWREAGTVTLDNGAQRVTFAKGQAGALVHDTAAPQGVQIMSIVPFDANGNRATAVASCKVVESAPDSAQCEVLFSGKKESIGATFSLDDAGAIRVDPAPSLKGLSVLADFAYGVLPSRQLDDNLYDAADYPKPSHLWLPSESLLVGLLRGGERLVVLAWPPGDQSARIALTGAGKTRRIEALEVMPAGRELYVGTFSAPGIWRQEDLQPDYEEQDVALNWKPPFEAVWKTQLTELGVPTTFRYADERMRPWRPTVGFYIWPFFTEGGKTILHLHKKLASTGKALIYALEGNEKTPYAFLTAHLAPEDQRQMTELSGVEHYYVLDPHPVEGGFIMNAHCAGRDQLKTTTLTVGAQAREVPFLDTHIANRAHECEFIVNYHVQRSLDCMEALSEQVAGWEKTDAGNPAVLSLATALRETLASMRDEYTARLDGKTPADLITHINEVATEFRAIIREDAGTETCPEILADINELNAIISLEEDQGRRFGTFGRKLFQQAGYACIGDATAAQRAKAFRSKLRDHLRYRQYESPGTAGNAQSLLPKQ